MCFSKCPHESFSGLCRNPKANIYKYDAHCCVQVECAHCGELFPPAGKELCPECEKDGVNLESEEDEDVE